MDIINISSVTDLSGESPVTVYSNPVTTVVNDPNPCPCTCECRRCSLWQCIFCRCCRRCECECDNCDRCECDRCRRDECGRIIDR